jgi:uncharacterized membrane protein YjgN (DUF898 family)
METLTSAAPVTSRKISFRGSGGQLFGIYIVNWLLTVVTFGFYYPWAKAAVLRYLYQETEFEDSRFAFHGTGKEMFIGFIKVIAVFACLFAILFGGFMLAASREEPLMATAGILVFYAALVGLLPFAIHGAMRYRTSRSSWRGVRFGYRGNRSELVQKFIGGVLLTAVTFGIYGSWFTIDLRRYIIGNVRFGNIKFGYKGNGGDFFVLNLVGMLLSVITLGIYSFWYMKDLFNYYVNNITAEQEGRAISFRANASAGDYFGLVVGNVLLIVFTLGIGLAWANVRTLNFVFNNIVIDGELDVDAIAQTEAAYTDATGEDMVDALDIGII